MYSAENDFAEGLLRIFDNVLLTEEKALSKGYFSNLSIAELHTLEAIGPYEARAMSETASRLGITTGTLTVAIDRLVRKGYVERYRDSKDRRVVRICLTRQGKLAYRMHAKFHKLLVRRIMDPLAPDDRERLAALVREIDSFIKEQYEKYSQEENARIAAKQTEDQ
ncbi:MAG: MarR family transcriptional regulator [Clostridiaceae bacterium]|nr:MarR family transcriptional regulator [Oscillospiraceae bacterium]NLO62469.1 MarR family transcriptional regulator [Clostridiaceae bacterium]